MKLFLVEGYNDNDDSSLVYVVAHDEVEAEKKGHKYFNHDIYPYVWADPIEEVDGYRIVVVEK